MKFRVVESINRKIKGSLTETNVSDMAGDVDSAIEKAAKSPVGSGAVKIRLPSNNEESAVKYIEELLNKLYSYNMEIRKAQQDLMEENPDMNFQEAREKLGAPYVNLMLAGIPGAAKTSILSKWTKSKVVRPTVNAMRNQADRYDKAVDSGHPEAMEKALNRLNLLTKFVSSMEPEDIGGQVVLTNRINKATPFSANFEQGMDDFIADKQKEEQSVEDVLTRVPTKEYDRLRTTNPNEKIGANNNDLSILFLDEYNRGADKVRSTLLELINNHIIPWGEEGTKFMDKLVFTVAAINPSSAGEAGANELGGAELGRFMIVEFTPTKSDTMTHLLNQRFNMVNLLSRSVNTNINEYKSGSLDLQQAAELVSTDVQWMENWTRQVFILSKIFQGKRVKFDNVSTWSKRTATLPADAYAYAINSPRSYDIATAFTDGTKEDLLKYIDNSPLGHYNMYSDDIGGDMGSDYGYDMLEEIKAQLDDYADPNSSDIRDAIKQYASPQAADAYVNGVEFLRMAAEKDSSLEKYVVKADFNARRVGAPKSQARGVPNKNVGDNGDDND